MAPILLVALGGAAGAVARYVVDGLVVERAGPLFPWGTLVVNVSGSLVLGILFALAIERDVLPASIRAPLMIGFLGAYTTFSTLALETWRLWETGAGVGAVANAIGSLVLGLAAVMVGLAIGRQVG